MGKPAARLGDMTAHGGTIVAGTPTVLIGGMPAARVSDMHVCPMMNPGPVPHVGGPINLGSTGVFIGGMPAARVGDMAVCTGPPDSIVMGCFTVLIGETAPSGGSPGASVPGAAAPGTAARRGPSSARRVALAASSRGAAVAASAQKSHWIDLELVDEKNYPVPGEPYRAELPDGTVIEGCLPSNGRVRLDSRVPGVCKLTFPNLDKDAWGPVTSR